MSIHDIKEKINPVVNYLNKAIQMVNREDIFIVIAIILIGLAGFGLGKLSAMEKGRDTVQILKTATSTTMVNPVLSATDSGKGMLVASKNGTKYYFPWCSGASKINESNKVWFDSYESAQKAGLSAASNCPNLK